MIFSAKA